MSEKDSKFLSIGQAMGQGSGDVSIRGWIYRERGSNKFRFIVVRDRTNIIQCVFERDNLGDERFEKIKKAQIETSIHIHGVIKKDERAPSGYEINVTDFEIIGEADTFPITKDQSTEFLLDKRHLWIRSRKLTAVMKIRSTVTGAIHEFFRSRGYTEFNAPILQPSQCEGGSTLFEVKYYNEKVFLAQTWQLYAEAAIFALEKIYNVSPTFRAERSKTSRHLSEFWMAEMEAAWMDLHDAIAVAKDEIRFIVQQVLEKNMDELKILEKDVEKLKIVAEKPYPTITYSESLQMLREKAGMETEWGKDLRTIEEEKLMHLFDVPVVVTHYPKEVMGFYKPLDRSAEAPGPVAKCFDMLAPEGYGEIVGGSERDTDIEAMKQALAKDGEDLDNYEWYFDLRRYGSVPHSGYGVGVERVVAWICGLDNIKDAIPFPRTMLRSKP